MQWLKILFKTIWKWSEGIYHCHYLSWDVKTYNGQKGLAVPHRNKRWFHTDYNSIVCCQLVSINLQFASTGYPYIIFTHLKGIFLFWCSSTITTSLLVHTILSSSIIRFGSTSASDSTKLHSKSITFRNFSLNWFWIKIISSTPIKILLHSAIAI